MNAVVLKTVMRLKDMPRFGREEGTILCCTTHQLQINAPDPVLEFITLTEETV